MRHASDNDKRSTTVSRINGGYTKSRLGSVRDYAALHRGYVSGAGANRRLPDMLRDVNRQSLSNTAAIPCPPPMHIVTSA
jgi:predicted DNA repair protein MutK